MNLELQSLLQQKREAVARRGKPQSYDNLCKSQGFDYTGDSVVADIRELLMKQDPMFKSLMTTNSGPITVNRTSPVMVENMDGLMTDTLLTQQHLKLLNSFVRVPSAGPYFEWNRHTGYGSGRGAIGFGEGKAPKGGVSAFQRNGIYNKYMGVKGGITHQMIISGNNGGTIEDPETREHSDRAMELFTRLDRNTVFGDKDVKNEAGEEVHYDGLLNLLADQKPENIIDLEGKPLDYQTLDETIVKLVTEGRCQTVDGFTAYMNVHCLDGLSKQYQDRNVIRHNKDERQGTAYVPGLRVPGYDSQFGFLEFEHSLLLEEVEFSKPLAAADADAPTAPTTVTGVTAVDATTKMAAGTYYYTVSAFNDSGESLGTISAAIPVADGEKVTLTIARVAGATGYRIYRGTTNSTAASKWIAKIPNTASLDPTFVDKNQWRTVDSNNKDANGLCLIYKSDQRDLCISQMAPLMKMPLPQVDTTYPFLLLLYHVLVLKAPERCFIVKNCGTYRTP